MNRRMASADAECQVIWKSGTLEADQWKGGHKQAQRSAKKEADRIRFVTSCAFCGQSFGQSERGAGVARERPACENQFAVLFVCLWVFPPPPDFLSLSVSGGAKGGQGSR
jgi:hypothetical protein